MHLRNNMLVLEGGIQRNGTGGCALEYILEPNTVATRGRYVKAGLMTNCGDIQTT